jgi:hypothetical protein
MNSINLVKHMSALSQVFAKVSPVCKALINLGTNNLLQVALSYFIL